jgi:hypothetical protein
LSELDFARRSFVAYSSGGTPFVRSEPIGMPKIPDLIKNAAIYLYPTEEDAKIGTNFGGTGFLIAVPSKRHAKYGRAFIYAVTNWHVACQGHPVIRLNTKDGMADVIPLDDVQWEFLPQYDIAVVQILVRDDFHDATVLHASMLLTEEQASLAEIGPGDDVFMVGRFMDHDGGRRNRPALRFGNISIDPTPIKQENGQVADAYCIDLHSRSGYSGSPVFVYRTAESDLEPPAKRPEFGPGLYKARQMFQLLGIHFAQFPEMWEVTSTGQLRHGVEGGPLLADGKYIKGLSGMTLALPAWKINEVLNMPKLVAQREKMELEREAIFQREGFPPIPENVRLSAANEFYAETISESVVGQSSENPRHREDFKSLLNAAAKTKPQGDQT